MTKALFVVDVQQNMFFGPWSVPNASELLDRIQARIEAARENGEHVVFVQNDGPEGEVDEPESEGWQLALAVKPDDQVVRKTTQNVFESNPGLVEDLKGIGVDVIELCGVQSELCLRASALGAMQMGFKVKLDRELHGSFDGGWPGATEGPSAVELSDTVQAEIEALSAGTER
jgi:nicotinamidase-related amidase